jgi:hypothetical protein
MKKLAGIHESISFHCARYPFATIELEVSVDKSCYMQIMRPGYPPLLSI